MTHATMTAEQLIVRADKLLDDLNALNAALSARSSEIDRAAVDEGRAPTAGEKVEKKQISSHQDQVIDAIQELAFLTMKDIDESTTLAKLNEDIKGVNADLKNTLDRLKAGVKFTREAADVLAGLEAVAKGLLALGFV